MVAIDLITKHVQRQLNERRIHLRWDLVDTPIEETVPPDVIVLPETNQIKASFELLNCLTAKPTGRVSILFFATKPLHVMSLYFMQNACQL